MSKSKTPRPISADGLHAQEVLSVLGKELKPGRD